MFVSNMKRRNSMQTILGSYWKIEQTLSSGCEKVLNKCRDKIALFSCLLFRTCSNRTFFLSMKAKLTKGMKGSEVDVRADAFIEELLDCVNSISKELITKIWINFMCMICNRIDCARVHINI